MKRNYLAVLCAVLLSACGGGSGDETGTPPPTPTPTPTPTPPPSPTGALFSEGPAEYSVLALSSAESMLQLGYLTSSLSEKNLSEHDQERSCVNGGTLQISYSHPEQLALQVGEDITVVMRECRREEVDDVISGTLQLRVTSVDAASHTRTLTTTYNNLSLGSGEVLTLAGQLSAAIVETGSTFRLDVNVASPFNVTSSDGINLTLGTTTVRHNKDMTTAKYNLDVNGEVLTSGSFLPFRFATTSTLSGFFGEYPNAGSMTLTSSASSNLVIRANFVEDSQYFDIEFNNATALFPWDEAVEGTLWSVGATLASSVAPFRSDNFSHVGSKILANPTNFPLMGSIYHYFSRPVTSVDNDNDLYFTSFSNGYEQIAANTTIIGAIVEVTPSKPLSPGHDYFLDALHVTGNNGRGYAQRVDIIASRDAIASIEASQLFITTNDRPTLSVSAAFTNGDDIAAIEWRDRNNVGLAFTAQGSQTTDIDLSNLAEGTDVLVVDAEITSTRGLTAYSQTVLMVTPASGNLLTYIGQQGDYISQGQYHTFTSNDGNFSLSTNDNLSQMTLWFNGATWWTLDLAAPNNTPLAVGTYTNATRYPFQSPTAPGLTFSGDGRGCNSNYGDFEITQLEKTDGQVTLLEVVWDQHCERPDAPHHNGKARFVAN